MRHCISFHMGFTDFHIKPGYQSRAEYVQFDDRPHTMEWQAEVYLAARELFDVQGLTNVVDIGCGAGFKLVHFFGDVKTVGLDLEPNLSFLREKYPLKEWRLSDWSIPLEFQPDLIIASDIIEHLLNPNALLHFIQQSHPRWAIISTPERDNVRGTEDMGPPENPHHVREWNKIEFFSYINDFLPVRAQAVIGQTQFVICSTTEN